MAHLIGIGPIGESNRPVGKQFESEGPGATHLRTRAETQAADSRQGVHPTGDGNTPPRLRVVFDGRVQADSRFLRSRRATFPAGSPIA